MTHIAHAQFVGSFPRVEDFLLRPGQAARAVNCKLTSGALVPYNGLQIASVQAGSGKIAGMYLYRHTVLGRQLQYWMVWDKPVQVVRSPLANDDHGRMYFTGAGEPRMSHYAAAIAGPGPFPAAWYVLGVTPPAAAPALSVVGGSGAVETRAYCTTFATSLGEESAPSPAVTVSGYTNGSWNLSSLPVAYSNAGTVVAAVKDTPSSGLVTVTLDTAAGLTEFEWLTFSGVLGMTSLNGSFRIESVDLANKKVVVSLTTTQTYTSGGAWSRNAPHNTAGMTKRIYRTSTGTASTDFLFVVEVPVAQTTFSDTTLSSALGEVCPSVKWMAPPKDLASLTSLPNGCLVGLSGNEICLSEPYLPYAWPLSNRYALSDHGVAVSAANNGVIALTDNYPVALVGDDPAAMTPTTIETSAPCVSLLGVVDYGGGCLYPSNDGLWSVTLSGARLVSSGMFRQDKWAALNPASFNAVLYDGCYVFSHLMPDQVSQSMAAISVSEDMGFVEISEAPTALFFNPVDSLLYLALGRTIYKFDSDPGNPYTALWESGTAQLVHGANMAVAKVAADYAAQRGSNDALLSANAAKMANAWGISGAIGEADIAMLPIGGSALQFVGATAVRQVGFELLADDVVIHSAVVTDKSSFALPSGDLAERFKVRLQPTVPLRRVDVATSLRALMGMEQTQ